MVRIACFHSFRMSGENLRKQMHDFSNFGAQLAGCELRFPDGTYQCTPEQEAKVPPRLRQVLPPPYFEWWNARQNGPAAAGISFRDASLPQLDGTITYDGEAESIARVCDFLRREGPFDGVLGFSQGGSLAHLLCLMQEQGQLDGVPAFRIAIILSARATRHPDRAPLIAAARQRPLCLPTLVVYGGHDTDVTPDQTRELCHTIHHESLSEIFLPEGTHRVPILTLHDAAAVRNWVAQFPAVGGAPQVLAAAPTPPPPPTSIKTAPAASMAPPPRSLQQSQRRAPPPPTAPGSTTPRAAI